VPSQALLFRAEGMQVATVGGGDRIHLQDVSVGDDLGSEVEILSGVTTADQIVANPSLGLLEGQQVKVVQAARGYELSETSKPAQ
jgi:membrane fusion protein, multidrug efflux system